MAPRTFNGEKFPAAAPWTTMRPIIRRSISHRSPSRIASGASSATPVDPSAPAIAGSAAMMNTTQGTSDRRPPTAETDLSTIQVTVPFCTAIPNR